jgi:hypothetical protein
MKPTRSLLLIAIAAASLTVTGSQPALADGDPASDVLIYQQVFLPYRSPSPPARASLTALVAAANKAGYRIRVAVIQSPTDLGSIPQPFNKPTTYAPFLAQELAYGYKSRVLVVMPKGFGFSAGVKRAAAGQTDSASPYAPLDNRAQMRLLDSLPRPQGDAPDQLVGAAAAAVRALAKAGGHTLPANPPPATTSGSGTGQQPQSPLSEPSTTSLATRLLEALAAGGAVVAVGLAAVWLILRRGKGAAE